jgi:hypothetical protein
MCYSARVRQDLHTLVRRFGGDVDWSSFEALFRLRLEDNGIKISRALEANFENPVNSTGQRIREHIEAFVGGTVETDEIGRSENRVPTLMVPSHCWR